MHNNFYEKCLFSCARKASSFLIIRGKIRIGKCVVQINEKEMQTCSVLKCVTLEREMIEWKRENSICVCVANENNLCSSLFENNLADMLNEFCNLLSSRLLW